MSKGSNWIWEEFYIRDTVKYFQKYEGPSCDSCGPNKINVDNSEMCFLDYPKNRGSEIKNLVSQFNVRIFEKS